MPKKSKKEAEKQAIGASAAEAKATGVMAKSKGKKAAAKKKSVAPKPAAARKSSSSGSVREPSDDEIRTRAYFIAERRMQLSLQGDSAHDWVEARRQLIEEAAAASS